VYISFSTLSHISSFFQDIDDEIGGSFVLKICKPENFKMERGTNQFYDTMHITVKAPIPFNNSHYQKSQLIKIGIKSH